MSGPTYFNDAYASTSGTSIDWDISLVVSQGAWPRRIVVQLYGVSTNGTSTLLLQLGDSGGIENTGYLAAAAAHTGTTTERTDGFPLTVNRGSAAGTTHGQAILTRVDGNKWVLTSEMYEPTAGLWHAAGSKELSGTIDRLRLTTVGGTDTFDAGTVHIQLSD